VGLIPMIFLKCFLEGEWAAWAVWEAWEAWEEEEGEIRSLPLGSADHLLYFALLYLSFIFLHFCTYHLYFAL
jgi:hypothetical protein